ncbi:alpha/beta hydrolase fold domain-containing protein [Actinomycetospora endophytica]|uniref:Alpha/beta hydrolase fold domain-containing protein n=1 Tax=Actinomycetospora endophytica TaxID=2291215 RepID=A0ABS8PDS7_9PSEU|nr:alpha/beta hydrolase fold domain-containing protein [Actinomycetospora endophytica]MCD2196398.1 alpha/beta hydrolase fold domain-containing protein [Actinomycetospora endophytica]
MSLAPDAVTGTAAGVPYVLRPPARPRPDAPLVVAWHLMDAPRTERAFAAALPLEGLDAWRLYPGLPLCGARSPGFEEIMRLGREEPVLNLHGAVNAQAVAELPALLDAVRAEHGVGDGPVAVVGGSAGAGIAGAAVVEKVVEARAGVLISPLLQLRPIVAQLSSFFGMEYHWTPESEPVADRMDLVARSGELGRLPVRFIVGADDAEAFLHPAQRLREALVAGGAVADLHVIEGMGHALAEEPGVDPAPQTAHAARVDRLAVAWLAQAFELP